MLKSLYSPGDTCCNGFSDNALLRFWCLQLIYASKEFQPQQNLLSSLLSNIKKRGDGGTLNQGEVSIVGEKGPELMMAKQDVRITPNKDIKYVPSSMNTSSVQTVVRTIIQKQGKKIVNRTRIM